MRAAERVQHQHVPTAPTGPRRSPPPPRMQASLARVGIKLALQGFPSGTYCTNFAGVPNYVHQHDIGLTL